MSRRTVLCLVCGLLATCVLAFVAYRYLLSSASEVEVEHREQNAERRQLQVEYQEQKVEHRQEKVASKPAKISTWKVSSAGNIPSDVLSRVDVIRVEQKNATFTVDDHVSLS